MLLHPVKPLPQLPRLLYTFRHEFLPARPRVDGHDEDHIRRVEHLVGDRRGRGLRGDG